MMLQTSSCLSPARSKVEGHLNETWSCSEDAELVEIVCNRASWSGLCELYSEKGEEEEDKKGSDSLAAFIATATTTGCDEIRCFVVHARKSECD